MALMTGCLLLTMTTAGCMRKAPPVPSSAPGDFKQTHIQQQPHDTLTVDADIVMEANVNVDAVSTYTGAPVTFDAETVMRALLGDEQPVKTETIGDAETGINTQYTTADGRGLTVGENGVFVFSSLVVYLELAVHDSASDPFYNIDVYADKPPHSFATPEIVFAQLKESFAAMGVTLSDRYTCYTLDHQTMQQQAEHCFNETPEGFRPEKLRPFTADDDSYYIYLYTDIDNIPLTAISHGTVDDYSFVPCEQPRATVSADGIVSLFFMPPYRQESALETAPIISAQAALSKVVDKYNTLVDKRPWFVDKIRLEYVPQRVKGDLDKVTLVPAWVITYRDETGLDNDGEPSYNTEHISINAHTGAELL